VIWRVARGAAGSSGQRRAASRSASHPLAGMPASEREARVARGARLYEHHACFGCHEAARAEPGSVPLPLSGLASRYDVAGLERLLETPTPPMPVFQLSREERRDLATFLLHGFAD